MKQIHLDTETSGAKNPDKSVYALLQIAGIIVIDGKEVEEFNLKLRPFPSDVIEDEALEVNGLTRESIKSPDRLDARVGYQALQKILGKHISKFDRHDKAQFIAFNAPFDGDILRAFFRKNDDTYFGSWFWWPLIDVATLAGYFVGDERWKLPQFKLGDVARHLGIPFDPNEAHDGLYDVRISKLIHEKIDSRLQRLA